MHLKARRFSSFFVLAFLVTLYYLYSHPPFEPWTNRHENADLEKLQSSKYAYATFLGPPTFKPAADDNSTTSTPNPLQDPYFLSIRLLNYQILHSNKTRTRIEPAPPFLILALPTVPASQLQVLESEGATIVHIEPLSLPAGFNNDFIENSRFRDVLSKLRLWQLTDYEKVLYLDADSFLLAPLDDIFTAPNISEPKQTLNSSLPSTDTATINPPPTYLMSASTDTYGDQTEWEAPGHVNYLCACFMLFAPSHALFNYYMHILTGPEAPPNAAYPEQDLLIYVHRKEGRMPWTRIPIKWSANDGGMVEELEGGVRSLHVKGWEGAEGGNVADERTKGVWSVLVKEMKEFYGERLT